MMKQRMIRTCLVAALIVAGGHAVIGGDDAEKGKKEDKPSKQLVTANATGLLSTANSEKVVLVIQVRRDLQEHLHLTITKGTKFIGLEEGETIAKVRQGSKIEATYTHEKDESLYGTALTIKVIERR
jgi:hypothetical protein